MSSQDQTNKEQKTDTNTKFYLALIGLVFLSVVGAIIFLLKDKITKHFEKSDLTQTESPISPSELVHEVTSIEAAENSRDVTETETPLEIENFVAPESIPEKLER